MTGSTTAKLRSCLCTQAQLESAAFRTWAARMGEPPNRMHRKVWEWCYIAQGLFERNMLQPGRRGLGFAVGQEPLAALFAGLGCQVTATDLDFERAARAGWVDTHQHARALSMLNERGLCEPAEFGRRADFRVVDMNDIPADLRGYDFTWSACSLEHLGSLAQGEQFIYNSLACLKPGGVSIHTTEFTASSNTLTVDHRGTVLFRRRDMERIAETLAACGQTIESFVFDTGDLPLDRLADVPPYTSDVMLKLLLETHHVCTSVGFIITKTSDVIPGASGGAGDSQRPSIHPAAGVNRAALPAARRPVRRVKRAAPQICFARNGEDLVLGRALGWPRQGFYVDVGAGHPTSMSATRLFYERGWSGINVEPLEHLFESLTRERTRDVNLRAIVSDRAGELRLLKVLAAPDGEARCGPAGSADDRGPAGPYRCRGRLVEETTVPTRTLDAILDRHAPPDIDFLRLHLAGHESPALKGLDLTRRRPRILLIESARPMPGLRSHADWEPLVPGRGYEFAASDGGLRYYLRDEDRRIAERLRVLEPCQYERIGESGDVKPLRRWLKPWELRVKHWLGLAKVA